MTYTYKRGAESPQFIPFMRTFKPGMTVAKGLIIQTPEGPFEIKSIKSVEVLASGARVIGKGLEVSHEQNRRD